MISKPVIGLVFGFAVMLEASGLLNEVGRTNLIEQADAKTPEAEQAVVEEFEQKLLSLFGLTRRPTPSRENPIPRIMQHLYKAHMGEDSDGPHSLYSSWEPGFDLPHDEIASRVNTARSFHHLEAEERPGGLPDNHIRLVFNLSSLPEHEDLRHSELLLHREAIEHHLDYDLRDRLHRINLYEIIKMASDETEDSITSPDDVSDEHARLLEMVSRRRSKFGHKRSKEPITRLLDTRVVDTANTTWERFDVSASSMRWLKEPNHGLIIEIVREDNGESPNSDADKHVRLRRDVSDEEAGQPTGATEDEWHHKRPTLLAYTHDSKNPNTNMSRRVRRKRKANRKKKNKRRSCKREKLYVDFNAVSWDDWIVAPHGYDAYYCDGDCPFPLADYMNATNHAIVQTLVNAVEPLLAPMPCCVPTELSPIAMLYLDEYDLVILKTYQEMTVEACGCR